MQLKNILAFIAAASFVTAAPASDTDEGGEDEISIGVVVRGVAGTECGWTWLEGCENLKCESGHYIAFPAPSNRYNSYVVCQKK
ncbi:uncharacterized protein BO97DRAFT_426669 [Aspergillus homomorphus CBS 101889]|uniref:Uncharacterized protein n=1 Tax=Aspergillus homomorphus (strain CBS 101889) TaxID=1450537 RepID=A0A395HV86_ASPHC|nr:hypothetical protein BO97DRAFT_426669 [Aspergillus homomorphus CBS 101889]RAL10144.1 hypothetical protein BO97DRAFT_426669 [Aspergillus homomorphus CBS 101889]